MTGFITLPQAIMAVTGGIPVMPAGAMTIIERLRAAKSMLPGDMGGLMAQILKDGPGALLQNPIGAVMGQLQGQLGGLVSQIQGIANGDFGGLLSAIGGIDGLGGLQGALGQLSNVSGALSGLTDAVQGGFGLMDAIGHANIVSMLGEHLPAGLGIAEAMGPVLMGGQLNDMLGRVSIIADAVTDGRLNIPTAIASVTGMTDQIMGVLDAHTNAIGTIQGQVLGIAQAAGVVSLIASGPPGFGEIANMLIRDEVKPAIQEAMDEQIRPTPTKIDLSEGNDSDWS